jgi:hypothetical protein
MTPMLRFVAGPLRVKGTGVYRSTDMTLEYEAPAPTTESLRPPLMSEAINRGLGLDIPGDLLLIAGTLTLTFSGAEHRLVGLDAYTNRAHWSVRDSQTAPVVRRQGMLLAEPASPEDDRYVIHSIPRYEIASDEQWVRIVLNEESAESYYEVASALVIGLKGGAITDIYLFNVVFS